MAISVSGLALLLLSISMQCRLEQRAAIKMCVRAGENVKMTIHKLTAAWGDHALSTPQVRFWFWRFQEDPDHDTKDSKHTGRPTSKNTPDTRDKIQEQLQVDRRATVRQLGTACDVGKSTAHQIMKKELHLSKLAPKFVPRILTPHQRETRVKLCRDNVKMLEDDPGILARLIVTDESWVFTYDPHTKFADMEWTAPGQPCPRKVLRGRSQRKTMLILFFDSHGPLLTFFYDEGTIDSEVYIESIHQMREAVRRKCPALWASCNFYLLQDNASPHTSNETLAFLFEVDMAEYLWPHPQYSPDLSPCNFWAFPLLKAKICGHRFNNLEDVKTTVRRTLRAIPLADLQDCFDKLLLRY